MKDVGIVGLPASGCSTIFTALTALPGAAPGRSNQAVVPVPDARVDRLGELHASKKLVYTTLRFVETSGMVRRGARGGAGALSAELLGHLRQADALLLVCAAFGDADPVAQREELTLELVYADLEPIATKIKRDSKGAKTPAERQELATLERAKDALEAGRPLRDEAWDDAELGTLSALTPLTLKPFVAVANVEESERDVPQDMVAVAGALEAEVVGLDASEAQELLEGYGVSERGLPATIRALYEQLDLITFLTAGDKESRAWEVRRGASAPEAAGVIHSDFERGFIKADVIGFEELVTAGSWQAARAAGKVRQEGKAYVVQEGDVVEFRFAV